MTKSNWQPTSPLNAICFDCDGTLSSIEGIDQLALYNNVADQVIRLTSIAMERTGLNLDLYTERLELVKPTETQMSQLAHDYHLNRTSDIDIVISILKKLNKNIFIISAGNNPAVSLFGEFLGINPSNCFAININFDAKGQYLNFESDNPLIHNNGKKQIINQIKKEYSSVLHIGDGLNDLVAKQCADRFIGYGGHKHRQNIKDNCEFYITSSSLLPSLPLCLTRNEVSQLKTSEYQFYKKGLELLL